MSTQTKVRTITIFSTKGKRRATIETEVATWGDLKPLVSDEGYDLNKLLATENIRRTDLANEGAVLPEGDFTIFLRPTKTKSGIGKTDGKSFKELRAMVKELKAKHGDDFMNHLNKEGNYTRMPTDYMRAQIASYNPGSGTADESKGFGRKSEPVTEKKTSKKKASSPSVADVVDSVKESKEACDNVTIVDVKETLEKVIKLANVALDMLGNVQVGESEEEKATREAEEQEKLDKENAKQAEKDAEAAAEKAEQEAKEAAEKAAEEEQDRLDKEAADMMSGF